MPPLLPVALTDQAWPHLADRAAPRHDWFGEMGRPDRTTPSGAARRTADDRASATDPDAAPVRPSDTGGRLGFHDHDVVDGGKARIILTTLVTPAQVAEIARMTLETLRLRLIKIGGRGRQHRDRVRLRLASRHPNEPWWRTLATPPKPS